MFKNLVILKIFSSIPKYVYKDNWNNKLTNKQKTINSLNKPNKWTNKRQPKVDGQKSLSQELPKTIRKHRYLHYN